MGRTHQLQHCLLEQGRVNSGRIAMLAVLIELLSQVEKMPYHIFTLLVGAFSAPDLILPVKDSIGLHCTVHLVLVLLSLGLE